MAGFSWNKSPAILSFLLFIGSVIAKQQSPSVVNVIDANDEDIGDIAETVCYVAEGNESQISKISTIVKLVDFFEKLPPTHGLIGCRDRHSVALARMKALVSGYNDDVCGRQKIDMIVKMHELYILGPEDLEILSAESMPRVLQLFYMHYVYHLSIVCKKSLIDKLDSAEARENESKLAGFKSELKELDRIASNLFSMFGASRSMKNFYDITLLWTLLDRSLMGPNSGPFSSPSDWNNFKRVTFISSESYKVERCQRECEKLKSVYESPLLAVIRLIDIGYYVKGELFGDELAKRPSLRRLISLTIICETMLPVRAIQDDLLKPTESKCISNSDGNDYKPRILEPEDKTRYMPAEFEIVKKERNHHIEVDSLSFVSPNLAGSLADKLMANIRDRGRIVKRIVKGLMSYMMAKMKKFFVNLFHLKAKDLYPSDLLPLFNMLA